MNSEESIKFLLEQKEAIVNLPDKRRSPQFDKWKRRTRLIIEKVFSNGSLHLKEFDGIRYSLSVFSLSTPEESFQRVYMRGLEDAMGLIETCIEEIKDFGLDESEQEVGGNNMGENIQQVRKANKIFISHSSEDSHFGKAIVQLLRGLGLKRDQIVFTSDDDYGIPLDDNIFEYLKKQITNGVYILYLLSDNYYDSVACLNEMGAAWIVQNQYTIIGIPGFQFSNTKFSGGAIDPRKIGFTMDNTKRVIEFKNNILNQFDLSIDEMDWMEVYKKYCDTVEGLCKHK
ncbi:toll/interleukin-1 receptor domain-containing protein [Clostridium tagluense]|uniref:TIR domain-containing protein n=1 Tax=Clostridium tagluense TaxID=360422 RepID=A0A401URU7_9CLOT|nr:toll/interleukin-1 receptor domain-containing protein [Clostridium tagluense]GCD12255.1 hypothetical protein Ctaglu_38780 [Clostridium tagluense]